MFFQRLSAGGAGTVRRAWRDGSEAEDKREKTTLGFSSVSMEVYN